MAGLPPPLPLLVVIGAVVDLIYGTMGFTVVFAIPSYILWKEDSKNNKLQERDVADYETFFSFKNSIPYHNIPSFHVRAAPDVKNNTAEFVMASGETVIGHLGGYPQLDQDGLMRGEFRVSLPGHEDEFTGDWIAVRPSNATTGKGKRRIEALNEYLDEIKKSGKEGLTREAIMNLAANNGKIYRALEAIHTLDVVDSGDIKPGE